MGDRAKKRGANIGEDDGMYSLVIAEDEKMMRESLVKLVDWASLGFTMEAAFSDGAQLIDYLRTHIPDVVLTDIQMIRVDGMEVARFIHEHNLPTCVILLTGHKNFEYARSAIEYRVKRYLLKPITVPHLLDLFIRISAAGVFHAVGGNDEQRGHQPRQLLRGHQALFLIHLGDDRLAGFPAQPHDTVDQHILLIKRRIERGHRQVLIVVDLHRFSLQRMIARQPPFSSTY